MNFIDRNMNKIIFIIEALTMVILYSLDKTIGIVYFVTAVFIGIGMILDRLEGREKK